MWNRSGGSAIERKLEGGQRREFLERCSILVNSIKRRNNSEIVEDENKREIFAANLFGVREREYFVGRRRRRETTRESVRSVREEFDTRVIVKDRKRPSGRREMRRGFRRGFRRMIQERREDRDLRRVVRREQDQIPLDLMKGTMMHGLMIHFRMHGLMSDFRIHGLMSDSLMHGLMSHFRIHGWMSHFRFKTHTAKVDIFRW